LLIGTVRNVGYRFVPAKAEEGRRDEADAGRQNETGRQNDAGGQNDAGRAAAVTAGDVTAVGAGNREASAARARR
jgi:hypothetical protein